MDIHKLSTSNGHELSKWPIITANDTNGVYNIMSTLVAVVKFATMESTPVMPERANTLLDGMTMSDGSKYSRSVTVFWYERLVSMYCDRCSLAVLKSKAASPTCMHEIMQVAASWRSARKKGLQKIQNAKKMSTCPWKHDLSLETRTFFAIHLVNENQTMTTAALQKQKRRVKLWPTSLALFSIRPRAKNEPPEAAASSACRGSICI